MKKEDNKTKDVVKSNKKTNNKKEQDIDNVVVKEVVVEKKVGFNYLEVILIMVIMLVLGGFLGYFLTNLTKTDTVFKEEVVPTELRQFINTYNDIKENYYEDINQDELLNAGIKGMIDFLGDKYSVYMSPDETKSFSEQVDGKYTGIGVEIQQKDDVVTISKIFDGTPAKESGLMVNDQIIMVDDNDVTGKTTSEIAALIKNSTNSSVKLKVLRDNKEIEFDINLGSVNIESVSGEILEKNGKKVAYINISIFAANTYQQFLNKLSTLETEGFDSLVIDVRGNTGGYLSTVTDIASLFLEKGKVIYQLDTKGVVEKEKDKTNTKKDYNVAVLIDKGSASASEILAAALKESYGAQVVGTYSYGKGTVQKAYQLDNGATVKYTIQKWLTPKGNWINEVGVEPTVIVEFDAQTYYDNPSHETDNQLQKALEVLTK